MIQWFRGTIEACYVGIPINAAARQRPGAAHFKPRLYRALVRDVVLIDAPAPTDAADASAPPAAPRPAADLRAERIDSGVVAGVRGPGTSYEGPLFEVEIGAARFGRGTLKDGKSYGVVTGKVIGYCELPPPPPKPEVKIERVTEAAPREVLSGTLHEPDVQAKPAASQLPLASKEARSPRAADELAREEEEELDIAPPPPAPVRAKTERLDSAALPLTSAAAAIAIALWVTDGAAPALLWSVFLLPTLIARKLFHGVLRDSDGIRGFGIALIITQLFCASSLISSWWSLDCRPLSLLPLLGLVAVIFPSGLLPSALPLCLNAAGLALVLAFWGGGGEHCTEGGARPPAPPSAPPSVEHPGVPRTNPDGSWPKRPPG